MVKLKSQDLGPRYLRSSISQLWNGVTSKLLCPVSLTKYGRAWHCKEVWHLKTCFKWGYNWVLVGMSGELPTPIPVSYSHAMCPLATWTWYMFHWWDFNGTWANALPYYIEDTGHRNFEVTPFQSWDMEFLRYLGPKSCDFNLTMFHGWDFNGTWANALLYYIEDTGHRNFEVTPFQSWDLEFLRYLGPKSCDFHFIHVPLVGF